MSQQFNFRFRKEYSHAPKNVACRLSCISDRPHVAYLVLVKAHFTLLAMWDRFCQRRATIGVTQSCMHWCVRKKYLT